MGNFFDDIDIVDSNEMVSFNTNTLYDLKTGIYVQGKDNKWYLNGGLSPHINSFAGPNGAFKSTLAASFMMRTMSIYDGSYGLIHDTENSLDKDKHRVYNMAERLKREDLSSCVKWIDSVNYNIKKLQDLIIEICNKREANKKDLIIETPYLDIRTGKQLKTWIPFIIFIDSLTELVCPLEDKMIEATDKSKPDDNFNTLAMQDGNRKTVFLHLIRRLCQKYGIVFISTGHYDQTIQMDLYNPMPKETMFSKQNWKTKGCGSKYKFLSSVFAKTMANVLLDSSKESLYGSEDNAATKDLVEVNVVLERCKTQGAGTITPFVASQSIGLLNDLTNYHYLRINDYYGLNGSKMKQQSAFLPNITVSRNTVRDLAGNSYELSRALELTAQYCYIKNNWATNNLPFDFKMTPQDIYDKLTSDKAKTKMSDILNTVGYWTFKPTERQYMSLLDILGLINK